uniref:Uncharacterized protein n=1 Tax=Arundo donax TaxID=35708 RepID=A0A0A8ZFW0_ARUDO
MLKRMAFSVNPTRVPVMSNMITLSNIII